MQCRKALMRDLVLLMLYVQSEGLRAYVTVLNVQAKDLNKQFLSANAVENEHLNTVLYSRSSKPPTS